MPDERAGNGGQERKPRSEEKRRRRERTRGEGDSTGLRHENERLQRRNERLRRENDRLKRKTDHLEKQLAAARRAGFRQAAPFAKDRPQGRGGHPGRRAGAAYGRQASRPRPAQVDEHYAASAPAACPDCGGAVAVTRVASQYQEELPVVRPVVRRFDIEVGHCSQCQRRVQGRHVLQTSDALGAAGVQLGPGVVALVVELHTEMGVPLAKVAHLLRTTFGLQVTPGGLAHVLHRAARAAAPAYTELCEQVRNAPVVTPDETGWRVGGERHWLWVFTTRHDGLRDLPRPRVRRRRHGAGDRLRRRARARRVGAVSLLRRTAPNVSESLAPTLQAPPGGSSRQSLGRRGAGGPAGRPRPAGPLQRGRAERARHGYSPRPTQRPPRSADRRTAAARRRRALRGAPGQRIPGRVPLPVGPLARRTNWRAEQAIRPAVVIRKVCGGNRTRHGADTQQVLASVVRTARQRGLDLPPLVAALLRAPEPAVPELLGLPPPTA